MSIWRASLAMGVVIYVVLVATAGLILLADRTATLAMASESMRRIGGESWSLVGFLDTEKRLTPSECDTGRQGWSAVAYDFFHDEYLVVWENEWPGGERDIYARRVSRAGEILSWFCITTGANNRLRPAVAYNSTNDQYLVVWMHEVSTDVYEIWGRRIPWNGPGSNAEFHIYSWTDRSFYTPRVAWNSYRNEYLVIWNAVDATTSVHTDIAGCRISGDGVIQPGAPIIITTTGQPQEADLVYNIALDRYMVVWSRYSATTNYDIYGALLDRYGTKITPPDEFVVYSGPSSQTSPAIATNEQDRYMVVWQHFDDSYVPGDWDIYGRVFQADGSPVTSQFMLSNTTYDETSPGVAANFAAGWPPRQFLSVWQCAMPDRSIVKARLRDATVGLSSPFDVSYAPDWYAKYPVVAKGDPGFLFAYGKGSTTVYDHVFGRLYSLEAILLPWIVRNQ